MMILSQYHIFELDTINIYSAPVVLKYYIHKPPRTCTITRIFSASNEGWTLEKIDQWQRETGTETKKLLPEQFIKISMCFQKSTNNLNIYFSFEQRRLKIKIKLFSHDLILKAIQNIPLGTQSLSTCTTVYLWISTLKNK